MRIVLVHNYYKESGGEDQVFINEKNLLIRNGHKVFTYERKNKLELNSLFSKVKIFFQVHYNRSSKKQFHHFIKLNNPDLVHVHNFFPLITPSIYDACVEEGIPVIQTLHNFRLICPTSILMHNGKIYRKSIEKGAYSSIIDKVYKKSYLGTYAVSRMIEFHKNNGTWENKVDKFIALTTFSKSIYVEAGFPKKKISIKPNFFQKKVKLQKNKRSGALYVGRISPEKGIKTLISAWQGINYPLKIVGDGPLISEITSANNSSIKSIGALSQNKVMEEMSKASFLILPSLCYEGFPMVILESFANSLPVIASDHGSISEIITNNKNGLLFEPGDSIQLKKKVKWMFENPEACMKMGMNAKIEYDTKYTPDNNYNKLIQIYNNTIQNK